LKLWVKKLDPNRARNPAPCEDPFAFADRFHPNVAERFNRCDWERLKREFNTSSDEPLLRI
jgi:hypothetical protein